MLINFVNFRDLADVASFSVFNATPEREDGVLGTLPDGRPVWPVYTDETDPNTGEVIRWVTAEVSTPVECPRTPYKFGGGVMRSDYRKGRLTLPGGQEIEINQSETRAKSSRASDNFCLVEAAPVGAEYVTEDYDPQAEGDEIDYEYTKYRRWTEWTRYRRFDDGWVITGIWY